MRRVLLVDTGFSAEPIYRALKSKGLEVFTIGRRSQDLLASGYSRYICSDYSKLDDVRAAIKQHQIEMLVPGCTDKSYEVCSQLAQEFGFPGFESCESLVRIHNKLEFRRLCEGLEIPVPAVFECINGALEFNQPVMVKPIDSYSGRGLTKVEHATEIALQSAISIAKKESPSSAFLIEEFVSGDLFSFSAFLVGGNVVTSFCVAEYGFINPFAVDVSYVAKNNPFHDSLTQNVELIANALSISSGLIHLQYIVNGQNYWLIEATRRCPGDLYASLIRHSTGYPYAEAYLSPFIEEPPSSATCGQEKCIVRQTVMADRAGKHYGIVFDIAANLIALHPTVAIGGHLEPGHSGRAGIAFYNLGEESSLRNFIDSLRGGGGVYLSIMDTNDG